MTQLRLGFCCAATAGCVPSGRCSLFLGMVTRKCRWLLDGSTRRSHECSGMHPRLNVCDVIDIMSRKIARVLDAIPTKPQQLYPDTCISPRQAFSNMYYETECTAIVLNGDGRKRIAAGFHCVAIPSFWRERWATRKLLCRSQS